MERLIFWRQNNRDNIINPTHRRCVQNYIEIDLKIKEIEDANQEIEDAERRTLIRSSFDIASSIFNRIIMPHKAYCLTRRSEIDAMFEEYKDMISYGDDDKMTGWERVKRMWKGALYETSSEFDILMNVFIASILGGFVWGATVGNIDEVRKFKKRHNEMVFEGEFLAKRKYMDLMMVINQDN